MKREKLKWLIFVLIITFFQFLYIYAFFIEPNWITIEKITVVHPKLAAALGGTKLVHISDLHIEQFGRKEISLIEKINALQPDIIVITGDLVETRSGINQLWNILSLFQPTLRTYAVYGDNDGVIADLRRAEEWTKTGVSLIEGKALSLNSKESNNTSFWLIGAAFFNKMPPLPENITKDTPIILIAPEPEIIKFAALKNIDLVLCGGTHGGQIGLPLLWKFFPYGKRSQYIRGLYKVKNTLLYVNRGIASQKGIRFLCPPEITVFEFVSKGKMKYKILPQDR